MSLFFHVHEQNNVYKKMSWLRAANDHTHLTATLPLLFVMLAGVIYARVPWTVVCVARLPATAVFGSNDWLSWAPDNDFTSTNQVSGK
jgi:hypothetical protein